MRDEDVDGSSLSVSLYDVDMLICGRPVGRTEFAYVHGMCTYTSVHYTYSDRECCCCSFFKKIIIVFSIFFF